MSNTNSEIEDAHRFLAGIKARLTRLVEHRPFVFKETRREDATAYLQRQKILKGVPEEEVNAMEEALGVTFPTLFRVYLSEMGNHPGELFRGSSILPKEYPAFQEWAHELLEEDEVEDFLEEDDFTFLFHQGYTFCYFKAEASYDTPVFQYSEGTETPQRIASGFAGLLESELYSMEHLHQSYHDDGGHFVTVSSDGHCTFSFPAKNAGIRPLDIGDSFLD